LLCFGVFGGICREKLENVTFDNQPGQYSFNTLELQGFHVFDIRNLSSSISLLLCVSLDTNINDMLQSGGKF